MEDQTHFTNTVKGYLAHTYNRIKLHDLAMQEVTTVLANITDTQFPIASNMSIDDFIQRLKSYEEILTPLQSLVALVTYWGGQEHLALLGKIMPPLIELEDVRNAPRTWFYLRWYPAIAILYTAGVGAVAAGNYAGLAALLTTQVDDGESAYERTTATVVKLGRPLACLEDESKKYLRDTRSAVPFNDYLFDQLRSKLEALLFLGTSYKRWFDRFEALLTLVHADLDGPRLILLGKFGWKHFTDNPKSPGAILNLLSKEAEMQKEAWPPLKAGLFGGSYKQFVDVWTVVDQHVKARY